MAKVKYYYNTKTLNYQRIKQSPLKKVFNIITYLVSATIIGVIIIIVLSQFVDSPEERKLKIEITDLVSQYNI